MVLLVLLFDMASRPTGSIVEEDRHQPCGIQGERNFFVVKIKENFRACCPRGAGDGSSELNTSIIPDTGLHVFKNSPARPSHPPSTSGRITLCQKHNSRIMKLTFCAFVAVLWLLLYAAAGFAATTNVTVAPNGTLTFSPSVVTINAGDQVTWTWATLGAGHTSTSGSPCTANGLWSAGEPSFTFTFTTAGNYPYFCIPHCSFGMTGEVIVNAAANQPPTVQITNPPSGSVRAAPASVTIQATASDPDGSVTNVQFLVGASVLTNKSSAPFTATANNLAAGTYTLSAIASDNGGAKATNSVTISVVTPVTVRLTSPVEQPPSRFQFSYSANTGLTYFVQRSTNLSLPSWISLRTNVATTAPVTFVDSNAPSPSAFYRVGRLPNP
jgi:plastocyanin